VTSGASLGRVLIHFLQVSVRSDGGGCSYDPTPTVSFVIFGSTPVADELLVFRQL
jgi:hypothetical protein